jgi:hypothetical protein
MCSLLEDPYKKFNDREFAELRDLADCRLTLFNARRGGEPARLTVRNWLDAKSNVWLSRDRLDSMTKEELQLFANIKVMYQTGKGNHLVPFLIPQDTQAALDKLSDEETRNDCGILPTNEYLFPSTKYSTEHVYGWYAVRRICVDAGVTKPRNLTATKMRHRVSTLDASLDVPESQRCHFYKHMGHSASTNAIKSVNSTKSYLSRYVATSLMPYLIANTSISLIFYIH